MTAQLGQRVCNRFDQITFVQLKQSDSEEILSETILKQGGHRQKQCLKAKGI